jgi:leucyl aminopeptidase
MEFAVKVGHPLKQKIGCIILPVYESGKISDQVKKLDSQLATQISALIKKGDIEGKMGQTLLFHPSLYQSTQTEKFERILLVGCGKVKALTDSEYKDIILCATQALKKTSTAEAFSYLAELEVQTRDMAWKIKFATELMRELDYEFNDFKSKKSHTPKIKRLRKFYWMIYNKKELYKSENALEQAIAISDGVNLTKDLANTPANICTPSYLAKKAEELAKLHKKGHKISVAILEAKELKALKMGSFLSVTQGSPEPPKLITLSYRGAKKKDDKPIVLVGKGITFDTGGNSLKPAASMIGMKYDMSGAAAVMGVMHAAASLQLPLNIIGVIPSCENTPGGKASRPDDIVTSMSGITIEIANTDAEGRLILCDALTYCERYHPEVVIDIATLTGAVIVALGGQASAIMSNHQPLANDLLKAGQTSLDRAWQLPIWEEYQQQLKSPVADLCNIGGPEAGSITAACFLANFTKNFHWAHLDVAGTAAKYAGDKKGATGRPVPMLMQYLINKTEK